MDMIEELGYPTIREVEELYAHFYGRRPDWNYEQFKPLEGVSTAQISEEFKRYLYDPRGAQKALERLLEGYLGSIRSA